MAHKVGYAIKASEGLTIVAALRVAVDVYTNDAKESAENERLAEQFRRQAKEADALATEIEDREVVRVYEEDVGIPDRDSGPRRAATRLAERIATFVTVDETFENVMRVLQPAEEIGGPSEAGYITLMERLANEIATRAKNAREILAAKNAPSFDHCEAAGLDGTVRDGKPPATWEDVARAALDKLAAARRVLGGES